MKFCWDRLNSIISDPPPRLDAGIANSVSDYHWNNFLALVLPLELSNPDSAEARSILADLAFSFHHTVVRDLMEEVFRQREAAYNDFLRLQRMVMISACMWEVHRITKDGNSFWTTPDVPFEGAAYATFLTSSFENGRMPVRVPSLKRLGRLAVNEVFRMVSKQRAIEGHPISNDDEGIIRKRIEMSRGFDDELVSVAFDWLRRIDEEHDLERRREWISTVVDMVYAFLEPLGGTEGAREDAEERHHDFNRSIPHRTEQWLFALVSSVVPMLSSDEQPERLWQPLLQLGLERKHWVTGFLSSWFLTNLKSGPSDGFFREWKKMIRYANGLENWRHVDIRGYHDPEELFQYLMGFSSFGFAFMDHGDFRSQFASFRSEYAAWADEFLHYPESMSHYAGFLCSPSAKDYLEEGLQRLADELPKLTPYAWQDRYHLDAGLMKLVSHVWQNEWDSVRTHPQNKTHFMIILKVLSDRQVPRALEVQDEIAREPN